MPRLPPTVQSWRFSYGAMIWSLSRRRARQGAEKQAGGRQRTAGRLSQLQRTARPVRPASGETVGGHPSEVQTRSFSPRWRVDSCWPGQARAYLSVTAKPTDGGGRGQSPADEPCQVFGLSGHLRTFIPGRSRNIYGPEVCRRDVGGRSGRPHRPGNYVPTAVPEPVEVGRHPRTPIGAAVQVAPPRRTQADVRGRSARFS